MVPMRRFLLAVLIFVLDVLYPVQASATTVAAVAKCCPSEFVDCCIESVNSSKPLRCNGMELELIINVTSCIQETIHGEQQPKLNLTDAVCCDVFRDDDNDVESHCLRECIGVMQVPALKNDRKLLRIKQCRRSNPLYKCFDRCLRWRHSTNETFIFEDHCSIKLKMVPGKVYIGPEIA